MLLETNPITKDLNNFKKQEIRRQFEILNTCPHDNYLSLWAFLEKSPNKYYHKKAFQDTLDFLMTLSTKEPAKFSDIFKTVESELDLAFRKLDEINALDIHERDIWGSGEEIELFLFYENTIHPNYVKLIEGAFSPLIYPFAAHSRISRNKSLDGLDVFHRVEEIEIQLPQYKCLTEYYNKTFRNSIAHGTVKYKQNEIIYSSKKDKENLSGDEFIEIFDGCVDICNGMYLAFLVFFLANAHILRKMKISIPTTLLINELKVNTEGPGWEIRDCLEYLTNKGKNQLTIFAYSTFLDYFKLKLYVIRTAILAAKLTTPYDRYFFHLTFKYSKKGISGYAGFDGNLLRKLILEGSKKPGDYASALENGTLFFVPKVKLPKFLLKLSSFLIKFRVRLYLSRLETRTDVRIVEAFPLKITPKKTTLYKAGGATFYSNIKGNVIVTNLTQEEITSLVKKSCSSIVRKTKKAARRNTKWYSPSRYLRVGFMRINVYTRDFRSRYLGNSGLIPELLCTIELKRLQFIRSPDIYEGTPGKIGKYKIVWNKNALEKLSGS